MQNWARATASREAAQGELWMQLLPNRSLAGEQGTKAHPLSSQPTPAVASHCLNPNGSQRPKEPRWCRHRRQPPQVQSGARKVQSGFTWGNEDYSAQVAFPQTWSVWYLRQNHFGSLFQKQIPGLWSRPTKSKCLWCLGIWTLRKFHPVATHLRISGKYEMMGILNLANSYFELRESPQAWGLTVLVLHL